MRRKNNYILLAILAFWLVAGGLAAQEEPATAEQAPDALEEAQMEQEGRIEEEQILEDDNQLDIGLLSDFDRKVEPATGKAAEFVREKFGGSEVYDKNDLTDVPVFLRGFLANRPDMRLAEVDPGKLQTLADEFSMMEEDMTAFKEAKETGKWQNVDVFVRGRFMLNQYNGNEIQAEVSLVETGERYTAIASRLQYQAPMFVAKSLAENVESIILASSPEERKMLELIQFHKAKVDAANQSPEVNMIIMAAGTGGLVAGTLGLLADQKIMAFFSLTYGVGAWGAWFLQHSVAKENREEYGRLTEKYNKTYGERYVD